MEQPFLRQESAATSHAAWSPRSPAYEASRLRFYVLFVLSFFSCMQCACWFAFSSVDPALVKAYMGAAVPNDATIALLLNWGRPCSTGRFHCHPAPGSFRLSSM